MANETSLSLIQSLYVAYYGRPADPAGLSYWADALESNNGNIQTILAAFGNSSEFVQRFGEMDDATLVNNLYQQLFGRDAEPAGLEYWTDLLTTGQQNLAQIAYAMNSGAQGTDKQVISGRVEVAKAFTNQLDTAEEVAAYSTGRGIDIGKNYIQQVTTSTGATSVIDKVVNTVATLLPSNPTPAPTPTPTPSPPPPAPTFEIKVDNGVLSFSGTEAGSITVVLQNNGDATFTRGSLTKTLAASDYSGIAEVEIGAASVVAPATAVAGLAVTGTGSLELFGVDTSVDLSGVASELQVTAHIDQALDLTLPNALGAVDSFVVPAGVALTLSVAQKTLLTLSGAGTYELKDTAGNLESADLAGAAHITVTDAATIAQLSILNAAPGTLNYNSIKGTASDLTNDANSNGGAGTFVTDGKNVVVSDSATIAELDIVQDAIRSGTVTAENIGDVVANLISSTIDHSYIADGTNITVNDAATVDQMEVLDASNGNGALHYSLTDSVGALLAADDALVAGADTVNLVSGSDLGSVTVAELIKVLSWTNLNDTGLTYDQLTYDLEDTATNLIAGGVIDDYVTHAGTVTATQPAYVYQAKALYALDNGAVYDITDGAATLGNASADTATVDAIKHGVNLVATGSASAAQAQLINERSITGTATYDVYDNYSNLTNAAYSSGINGARDLTVGTSWLSEAQANTIVAFGNSGLTSIPSIRDNAANINTFVSANAWDATLHYSFYVWDSSANILAAIDSNNLSFITGNSLDSADHTVAKVEVSDTFTLSGAKTFWETVDPKFVEVNALTATKTTYYISDSIANFILDEQPDGAGTASAISTWVHDADIKTVTGTAADMYLAQQQSRLIFGELDSADHIVTSGSAGYQSLQGSAGSDTLDAGDDNDVIYGNAGSDRLLGGNGDDSIFGGTGNDTIIGGAGFNNLYGNDGRDVIYAGDESGQNTNSAGLSSYYSNQVTGGNGGDNMFGSANKDVFIFTATNGTDLIAEAGKDAGTRDYITNFFEGDIIRFASNAKIQFLGNGSANASSVEAGEFGLSIRYEKDVNTALWNSVSTQAATKVSIDIAKADGTFDNIADAIIILVGSNIDINVDGTSITFGG